MKLSDAIRKGCEILPTKARGTFFSPSAACALGAAYAGMKGRARTAFTLLNDPTPALELAYPCLHEIVENPAALQKREGVRKLGLPVYLGAPLTAGALSQIIVSLNDLLGWTREDIADWLDRLYEQRLLDIRSRDEIEADSPGPEAKPSLEAEAEAALAALLQQVGTLWQAPRG